jgi:hypothetical protein
MKNQKAEKYLNEVKGKKEKIWKFLNDMVEKQNLWSIEKEVVNVWIEGRAVREDAIFPNIRWNTKVPIKFKLVGGNRFDIAGKDIFIAWDKTVKKNYQLTKEKLEKLREVKLCNRLKTEIGMEY